MLYTARIDRPLGTRHPKHPDIVYPVNYGYIPGIIGGDGDEQDVYILGVDEPLDTFTGELIAVIHRRDDVEDKWVLAPEGMRFTAGEIMAAVHFQEQYFDSVCVVDAAPLRYVKADGAHEDGAVAIRLACLREVACLPEDHEFPADFIAATRAFFRRDDQTTLLCMQGENPVACMVVCWDARIPTLGHPTGRRAHVMNVYTAPDFRRQGIARRMFRLVHREAEQRGVTEITLNATAAGRPLYEQLGFRANDEGMYLDVGRD